MPTASPEAVVQAFYQAFNNGDLETIISLYEPRAILVAQPDQLVNGLDALRQALREFVSRQGTFAKAQPEEIEEFLASLSVVEHGKDGLVG